jgi:hypothetical protein
MDLTEPMLFAKEDVLKEFNLLIFCSRQRRMTLRHLVLCLNRQKNILKSPVPSGAIHCGDAVGEVRSIERLLGTRIVCYYNGYQQTDLRRNAPWPVVVVVVVVIVSVVVQS